ncbi:hypothetical protein VHA_002043 [Grimontia hollisae CIP 101886]|uniref:Uncharacterized protein n=1 Tax=Grimontia hollisae CIP 101886 TaxID=675812 RepID=D0I8G8_GRIHO|nr:hypothetical protein VHA_002043 [Grimontia hollisae CIP 101886]
MINLSRLSQQAGAEKHDLHYHNTHFSAKICQDAAQEYTSAVRQQQD